MADGSQPQAPLRVVVLIPLRDDWVAATELLLRLDQAVSSSSYTLDVLLVDDGSVEPFRAADFPSRFSALRRIQILRLRRNLGHQRAIAIGLAYVEKSLSCDAVLVMDGDGEDTPEGALQLLRAFNGETAIFAKRSRRTESLIFRVFYQLYKILHLVLTGVRVEVGNFSILPARDLKTLAVMSELWNHYAAAMIRSGLPMTTTPIPRGHRIAGASKMNFVALAAHGMSAISVYGDVVGVRLLFASMSGLLLAAIAIVVVWMRFFANQAIPGWVAYSAGTLVVILVQFVTLGVALTFTFLSNRINLSFVPLRDYPMFVDECRDIYRAC